MGGMPIQEKSAKLPSKNCGYEPGNDLVLGSGFTLRKAEIHSLQGKCPKFSRLRRAEQRKTPYGTCRFGMENRRPLGRRKFLGHFFGGMPKTLKITLGRRVSAKVNTDCHADEYQSALL